MISFHELQFHKKQSVYVQLINHVKRMILSGKLVHHDEMPSRRELAVQLSINPNTVQKAYKIMEDEGIISTISNIKSVVNVTDEIRNQIQKEFLEDTISSFVKECQDGGLSFQDTISLISKYWEN